MEILSYCRVDKAVATHHQELSALQYLGQQVQVA